MNRSIDTKKMILNAILIAIGTLLHQITPALGLPMQPDFALAMLFIIIIINKDYKTTLISAIIIGVMTALTTKFPGGQVPNIIDKVVTSNIMYFILLPLKNRVSDNIKMIICLSFGTILSGVIFLISAQIIVGLPAGLGFNTLVGAVVLPAAVMNVFLGMILYKSIVIAFKATGVQSLN